MAICLHSLFAPVIFTAPAITAIAITAAFYALYNVIWIYYENSHHLSPFVSRSLFRGRREHKVRNGLSIRNLLYHFARHFEDLIFPVRCLDDHHTRRIVMLIDQPCW